MVTGEANETIDAKHLTQRVIHSPVQQLLSCYYWNDVTYAFNVCPLKIKGVEGERKLRK